MENKKYIKKNTQIKLEKLLYTIKYEDGITLVSQLKEKNPSLYNQFIHVLSEEIIQLLKEKTLHNLLASYAKENNNEYYEDTREYAAFYEACSETLLFLYNRITKTNSDNYGRIRIDVLFDEPDDFVKNLRYFIENGIIRDSNRRSKTEEKHRESLLTTGDGDDDEIVNKVESRKYNKYNIDNGFDLEDSVLSKLTEYEPELCQKLLMLGIDRLKSNPIVALVFLLYALEEYTPKNTIGMLVSTTDFNRLFHIILDKVAKKYDVDLSTYDTMLFDGGEYLENNFNRSTSKKKRRSAIDHVAGRVRKIMYTYKPLKKEKDKYMDFSNDGKTYCMK